MNDFVEPFQENEPYLAGQLLIAMPGMQDPRFVKTVIYMCAHNADGAIGLVVNRAMESLSFPDMLEQLGIKTGGCDDKINIHFGGPVESGRGFVLHSRDCLKDATMVVDQGEPVFDKQEKVAQTYSQPQTKSKGGDSEAHRSSSSEPVLDSEA